MYLIGFLLLSCFSQSKDSFHLIVNNHVAFVNTHARLCQDLIRLCRHSAVYTYLGGTVCLVAGSPLIGSEAFFLAVENCLYNVVDASQIRSFDLCHMAGFVVCKIFYILQSIAPLIGNQFYLDAPSVYFFSQAFQANCTTHRQPVLPGCPFCLLLLSGLSGKASVFLSLRHP